MAAVVLTVCCCLTGAPLAQAETFARPDLIGFGASAAEIERTLAGKCAALLLRQIDPPFLPDVRKRQMQIDCDGFVFAGQPRHIEFVFRDDRLVMVWLMLTTEEAQGTIAAMSDAYGAPTHRNGDYVAFEHRRAAWRFEPAEILFYAPELDADMAPDFD